MKKSTRAKTADVPKVLETATELGEFNFRDGTSGQSSPQLKKTHIETVTHPNGREVVTTTYTYTDGSLEIIREEVISTDGGTIVASLAGGSIGSNEKEGELYKNTDVSAENRPNQSSLNPGSTGAANVATNHSSSDMDEEDFLEILEQMGFGPTLSRNGLLSGGGTVTGAIEWILAHPDDDTGVGSSDDETLDTKIGTKAHFGNRKSDRSAVNCAESSEVVTMSPTFSCKDDDEEAPTSASNEFPTSTASTPRTRGDGLVEGGPHGHEVATGSLQEGTDDYYNAEKGGTSGKGGCLDDIRIPVKNGKIDQLSPVGNGKAGRLLLPLDDGPEECKRSRPPSNGISDASMALPVHQIPDTNDDESMSGSHLVPERCPSLQGGDTVITGDAGSARLATPSAVSATLTSFEPCEEGLAITAKGSALVGTATHAKRFPWKKYGIAISLLMIPVTVAAVFAAIFLDDDSKKPSTTPSHSIGSPSKFVERLICAKLPGSCVNLATANTSERFALEWLAADARLPSYSNRKILQRFTLATLFYSTSGLENKTGWMDYSSDECDWANIECLSNEVKSVYLASSLTGGVVPRELALLNKSLELLNLCCDGLSGSLPTELGMLSELKWLAFERNALFGSIPTHLGLLSKLEKLQLSQNELTGTMPKEICGLRDGGRLRILGSDCLSRKVQCPCCTSCCNETHCCKKAGNCSLLD